MSEDEDPSASLTGDAVKIDQGAYAEAALLLTESLIHGLCELAVLSTMDAVKIVDRAVSVQHDRATELGDTDPSLWQSHALLTRIANSLKADLKKDPFTLRPVF